MSVIGVGACKTRLGSTNLVAAYKKAHNRRTSCDSEKFGFCVINNTSRLSIFDWDAVANGGVPEIVTSYLT
ncbi:hypothetical protein L596_003286 [Steinernema carpocapsae]|uniref:Uncharacterized protein n=1 Tax=Steinernema carpocapsae TaxID=34508 RepID=A0A4U8US36_STECR|nr:hypothetical protein L596_003286 [Steinernema carpocapsae]